MGFYVGFVEVHTGLRSLNKVLKGVAYAGTRACAASSILRAVFKDSGRS